MKIAFTICSNNYLSQAKTLGDSLAKFNPEYKFIIGLCDKKNDLIDYSFFEPYEILEVENIEIENFEWMIRNYNIIELNTSIKPAYFLHFLSHYKAETVIYFDPDIEIFNSLAMIEEELDNKSALITPHITTPIPEDGKNPNNQTFLEYGIYNLGFIAIRRSDDAISLLKWWDKWLSIKSFDRVESGLFVDQLPMNYAPIFFENVCVSKTAGYNFAYWNFHERTIGKKDNIYYINDACPLIFFHFSSFKPVQPLIISGFQNRYDLDSNVHLKYLYSKYAETLLNNKYTELKPIPCYYVELRKKHMEEVRKAKRKEKKLTTKLRRKIKGLFYK